MKIQNKCGKVVNPKVDIKVEVRVELGVELGVIDNDVSAEREGQLFSYRYDQGMR
jgi:hypothetical protein